MGEKPAQATILNDSRECGNRLNRCMYLRGFSQRKQTRTTGLWLGHAQSQDRKAVIENWAELKTAEREQIEEAEAQKQQELKLLQQQQQQESDDRKDNDINEQVESLPFPLGSAAVACVDNNNKEVEQ